MRVLVSAFEDVSARRPPTAGLHGLDAVVEVAVRVASGPAWASVTLANGDQFWTSAATHEQARQADELQYALAAGPCVDAILDDMVYHVGDVARDPRWPGFVQAAARPPVASMLSCPMVLMPVPDSDLLASLNIYAGRPGAFDEEVMGLLLLLAAYGELVGSVVEERDRAFHLENAVTSNRAIGIAIGVVMVTQKLNRHQAFDRLKAVSQRTNRKLRDLAAEIADTGVPGSVAESVASGPSVPRGHRSARPMGSQTRGLL